MRLNPTSQVTKDVELGELVHEPRDQYQIRPNICD